MAHIPVEKNTGGSWWKWLLALLVIGGLIWIVAEAVDTDDPQPVTVTEPVPVEPTPAGPQAGGVITDLATLTNAPAAADLYGRELQVNNLYVTRVVSDQAFFVCSTEAGTPGQPVGETGATGTDPCISEEVLVMLDEQAGAGPTPPPGTDVEGAVDVNEGQLVTIRDGRVEPFEQAQAEAWGLARNEIQRLSQEGFYIRAEEVNITKGAGTA